MAELASGAVTSLLGVIRKEAQLLRGVRGDVQFIKEEMESMNSFLAYLAKSTPPSGEHDEQVQTWMNQVRLLAQDCNDRIDLYLYRGNPEIHRASGGLRRYVWWLPWFLRKIAAQHRAAIQLRELKERARDVGERRLRYGVQVPPKALDQSSLATPPSSSKVAAPSGHPGDDEEDGYDHQPVVATTTDHSASRRRSCLFEPRTLDDYFQGKLREWIEKVTEDGTLTASVAIVAPDRDKDALALAHETLVVPGTYYHRSILVDIPAVHSKFEPLRPKDILYYILLELKHGKSQSQHQGTSDQGDEEQRRRVDYWLDINYKRKMFLREIKTSIVQEMKVYEKLERIEKGIQDRQHKNKSDELDQEQIKEGVDKLDLEVLLPLLLQSAAATAKQDHVGNKVMQKLATSYGNIMRETAKKLKGLIEAEEATSAGKQHPAPICLDDAQYERILLNVFPMTSNSKPLQAKKATKTTAITLGEDRIKQMIHEAKQEILRELQEGKSYQKNQAAGELDDQGQILEDEVEEIVQKIKSIKRELKEQLKIQGIVNKIKHHLKDVTPLIILKIDDQMMDGSTWKKTRNALVLLQCDADALVITTKNTHQAKEYCYPWQEQEPIYYTLAGFYHDTVLELVSHQKDEDNYQRKVLRDILDECEPHEFCMKIFAHALYAKPKRSNEELHKSHTTLQVLPKSSDRVAKKMFKFSYNDLPKEHRSCLLYLAIFPQGYSIRRSTLIGRWVVEGLITKEDWSTSVHHAERCFDMLIDRWLLYPGDISASGKVKSCMVGDLVHGFITKIARKQHIVETRLSHHLARHFSIFNDIGLRGSDQIKTFLKSVSKSSKWSHLKVLDLEGCQCFKKNNYLKEICSNILLLKYLSLKGTDATHLPDEINNLHELEVFDIRQTEVPASPTKHLVLLKLKRLLAGNAGSGVRIPHKIGKMLDMEVLSNVKASLIGRELIDIGKLWKLQKLGLVIEDKDGHVRNLLRAVSDLHECLQSLSVTLPIIGEDSPIGEIMEHPRYRLKYSPKVLQSLSITGTTEKAPLLQLLTRHGNQLTKVTLTRTWLNHSDLHVLAKLPVLRCVRFWYIACTDAMLIFKPDEFQVLEYFLAEGTNWTEIIFEGGAARELKKIVLSFTNMIFVHGVEGLTKLEELELNNNRNSRLFSSFDNAKQINKLTLRGTFLDQDDLRILAKKPNLRSLVLLDKSCAESNLIFNEDDFPKLNILTIDCSDITKINFTSRSAHKLEKIVWTFTNLESLSGINSLPKLRVLEFNGGPVPTVVEEAINKLKTRSGFDFKHNKPENQEQAKGEAEEEEDDVARSAFCWKYQV